MLKLYYLRHGSLLVIFTTLLTLVSAQPTLKWVARYAGPDQMQDVPHSMTVDLQGNVYVTGQSVGEGTESDFITLKYDKNGHELWSKRYNNNSNLSDGPTGIATDLSGNVYVTGWSDLNGQSRVFTTIKYDPLGTVIWLREYAGIGNSWNIATAIAIDDLGYIYVIGASKGQEGNYDYVTIKYDFAGNEQWIRRFNSGENSDDYPNSLVIGKSGSVYITGESHNAYGTIKYDKDGHLLWTRRYNNPGETFGAAKQVILDKDENVIVTGESFNPLTNYDFVTIKYNPNGAEQWAKRYNSPGNFRDQGISVGVDYPGNVYVTGFTYNFNNWSDFATIKYDAAGNQIWVRTLEGPIALSSETPKALLTDSAGNTFVTGTSHPQDGDADFVTIGYDTDGNEIWTARFNDDPGSMDQAYAMALDKTGNVYLSGSIHGKDIATLKYASALALTVAAIDSTLYLGYQPACTRLLTTVSGGRLPYRYEWNPSGSSTPDINVCPTVNTTYTVTVTDADGKTVSGSVALTVIDVRCGKNKVAVCHNGTQLCLPPEAVAAHLAHGDVLGSQDCKGEQHPVKRFKVIVAPNPFANSTRIQYHLPDQGRVLLLIFDSKGQLISIPVNSEKKPGIYNVNFNATNLNPGIYYYHATFVAKSGVQTEKGKMIKTR